MIDMPLASTLRLLARARGLTATEIAQAIPRVGAATVAAWMRGEKMPGQTQLEALARAFGVPAAALLSELANSIDPARDAGERELLDAWRQLDSAQQRAVQALLATMTPRMPTSRASTPRPAAARAPKDRTR